MLHSRGRPRHPVKAIPGPTSKAVTWPCAGISSLRKCETRRVPKEGINWMFFRKTPRVPILWEAEESTSTDDIAFDFKVFTTQGVERIIRPRPFESARKYGLQKSDHRHKAMSSKTCDGKFWISDTAIAKGIPGNRIARTGYIDIMTCQTRRSQKKNPIPGHTLPICTVIS